MTLNQAVAIRVRQLLKEKNISQGKLELKAGITHSTMSSFLGGRYKSCNLTTVVLIIRALDMTIADFFNDTIFESPNLIVE